MNVSEVVKAWAIARRRRLSVLVTELSWTRPLLSLWKPTHAESLSLTRGRVLCSTLTQLNWVFDGGSDLEMPRPRDNLRGLMS